MNKRNNAQIGIIKRVYAVTDYKLYDEKQHIWRGTVMPGSKQEDILGRGTEIFFSREYKDIEWDHHLREWEFDNKLFGIFIILVPTEKVLFAYQPNTNIIIPMGHFDPTAKPRGRTQ